MNKWKTFGLCMAVAGTVSLCAVGVTAGASSIDGGIEKTVLGSTEEVSDENLSVAEVVKNSMPSMVSITNTSVQQVIDYFGGSGDMFDFFFNDFFGGYGYGDGFNNRGGDDRSRMRETVSAGSGVIIGEKEDEILIATNKHVVSDASELSVAFIDETAAEAKVLGESEDEDLALITVKKSDLSEDTLSQIKVIPLGSSEDIQVGQEVVAIGNALGYGQSASRGIVSALDREISGYNDYGQIETSKGLIQTDAAINPGNSGGALLDMSGKLVGINCAKYASTSVEGMGYAIPINKAEPILSDIANGEEPDEEKDEDSEESDPIEKGDGNAYLGITCVTISDDYAHYYGIPTGAYVSSVNEDSAAEKAGIEEGDIITEMDGTAITSSSDLKNMISHYSDGDTAELTVVRFEVDEQNFSRGSKGSSSYETRTVTVTFGRNESEEEA